MAALARKAGISGRHEKALLLTQWMDRLPFARENLLDTGSR